MARRGLVALFLFGSGFAALIYQVAWVREFRLVFGASTAASAAVLGIFMGGLGIGGLLIGSRADRHPRPLLLYAKLELTIAVWSALTPLLIWLVRWLYIAMGGSTVLGLGGATVLRLLFSALVLSVPTVLMGGTLPAAARAVTSEGDNNRRSLAVLYGVNTLGALSGVALSTFFMLEAFGTRRTLWLACLVNILVALTARRMAAALPEIRAEPAAAEVPPQPVADSLDAKTAPATSPRFVLAAACAVGFAFMLMELVWYRMLNPLLGGSTYTFGLILAVALTGIGLGGAAYSLVDPNKPVTLRAFAMTCLLEALAMAFPYALGDHLAVYNILQRSLVGLGFYGQVLSWTYICMIVVFPAALIAGFQFPLLIALLGRGRKDVGRQTGLAIAWNTAGAIAGSLAGGFGILPLLSATGAWLGVIVLLLIAGLLAALLAFKSERRIATVLAPGLVAAACVFCLTTDGPTKAWRNSHIGDVRLTPDQYTHNALKDWVMQRRRNVLWQADGVESSVGLATGNGLAFIINGRTDGNSRLDAPTQVMCGMVGVMLHPNPKKTMVVGLGTGSTAGWLGAVDSMERVDVVELEPAIVHVARECAPVNHDVLSNPKVALSIGDAREYLLTTREHYDLIVSEPSNPYRAGIAGLFTRDFYQSVAPKLNDGGLFLQWLQAYQVSAGTIRTVYATLSTVFPAVETWQTSQGDLLLVCSMKPIEYDTDSIRRQIAQEPVKSALAQAWRVDSIEGVFARYVANTALAHDIAQLEGDRINTDDRTLVEFAFARSVGRGGLFEINTLRATAAQRNEIIPEHISPGMDWNEVEYQRLCAVTASGAPLGEINPSAPADILLRATAQSFWLKNDPVRALEAWRKQTGRPSGPVEIPLVADLLAAARDDGALKAAEQARAFNAADAEAIRARYYFAAGDLKQSAVCLLACFGAMHASPWHWPALTGRAIDLAGEVAYRDKSLARPLYDALREPFSVAVLNDERENILLEISRYCDLDAALAVVKSLEPNIPWQEKFLLHRYRCYEAAHAPAAAAAAAKADLDDFHENEPARFDEGLK